MLEYFQYEYILSAALILTNRGHMIIEKQKTERAVNKPVKVLFPFRQIAHRTRTLHRLNAMELMV